MLAEALCITVKICNGECVDCDDSKGVNVLFLNKVRGHKQG